MIQQETRLTVADNSGAKEVLCPPHIGRKRKTLCYCGDIIVVAIKNVIPSSSIKKVLYRERSLFVRKRNSSSRWLYIRFDDNACVLLTNAGELRGSRIFGPVARELRSTNMKIVSLAPEVLNSLKRKSDE